MTANNGRDLKQELLDCVESVAATFETFPWENTRAYASWLAQTYYFVRHTTSFLALTASKFGPWQRERQYFQLRHLREESGHDQLLLDDLAALNLSLESFEELPETSALYQTQYYFIQNENPSAHWAYAYLLEGLAAKKIPIIIARVEDAHSPRASTFLREHMDADQGHFARGLTLVDGLNEAECNSFGRNLRQCAYFYPRMLDHIALEVTSPGSGLCNKPTSSSHLG